MDDPDLECLRMETSDATTDGAFTLQRSMSLVALEEPAQVQPPTQCMSVSDDDLEPVGDWAEQMQRESNERHDLGTDSNNYNPFHFRWLKISHL